MMKSAFVKSNVKLTATILIVLLLLSSITDSTNNVKNSELDENHPTLVKQDMRRFSMSKVFPGYIIVVLNHIRLFV